METQPRNLLARLAGDRRGAALIELAVSLPVLVMMMLGGVEIARYVLLHQKLDRVTGIVGDLVSQSNGITEANLADVFEAVRHVVLPFDLSQDGVVILSSVSTTGTDPTIINWQRAGGGALGAASKVGSPGGNAVLPAGFTVDAGRNVIVAEVFYDYEPWIFGRFTDAEVLYERSFFAPRFIPLTTLQ